MENKIAQLQMIEQNIQNVLMQKQTFQSQLIEVENALEEIEKSKVRRIQKSASGPSQISQE